MNVIQSIRLALQGLTANKLRSGLTMLGIIIGVAAVIALVAVGQGAQASVTQRSRAWAPTCWSSRLGPPSTAGHPRGPPAPKA